MGTSDIANLDDTYIRAEDDESPTGVWVNLRTGEYRSDGYGSWRILPFGDVITITVE